MYACIGERVNDDRINSRTPTPQNQLVVNL